MVTKTATVSLHANTYQVDPALVGRKVELVFSPFDLETVEVRYRDKSYGKALPHTISRHTHPKAKPETPQPEPPAATGIDYLALTAAPTTSSCAVMNASAITPSTARTTRSPVSYPSTIFSPPSMTIQKVRCRREYSTAAITLGIHPDAVRA
ncbi:mu transposase family protein [Mycobacterium xenopi 3993]|nr:mu transposase family protein [Mycobacterium xenopi 3993]